MAFRLRIKITSEFTSRGPTIKTSFQTFRLLRKTTIGFLPKHLEKFLPLDQGVRFVSNFNAISKCYSQIF